MTECVEEWRINSKAREFWEAARREALNPPYRMTWSELPEVHKAKWIKQAECAFPPPQLQE